MGQVGPTGSLGQSDWRTALGDDNRAVNRQRGCREGARSAAAGPAGGWFGSSCRPCRRFASCSCFRQAAVPARAW